MKSSRAFFAAFIVMLSMVCGTFSAKADDSWIMRPMEKLGRGITNVVFSPCEIPMKWAEVTGEKGGAAGLTYGTLRGVCYVIARICVGAVDIITFPVPLPGCPNDPEDSGWGYGPILTPAWVVPVGSDWNNFIYDDTAIINPAM